MARTRPELRDIYRLADQLERDRELSMDDLKRRDHRIAHSCEADSEEALLLQWLDRVAPEAGDAEQGATAFVYLSRLLAALLGFGAMAGFLLGSGRGLVNVFILLAVFVFLQLLMSLFAAFTLLRTATGHTPASLPASPARWLALRGLPDRRYLREAAGVLRLVFLRHGQYWGALFTVGALAAFVLLPALSDYSFVWGSTFQPGVSAVHDLARALAAPWSALVPGATVSPEVVASSRYHPALLAIDRAGIESMRGWWGFLFLCLLVYALLPRLLLLLAARLSYPRLLRRTFVGYPGADLVLARMRRPLVQTQAPGGEEAAAGAEGAAPLSADVPVDGRLLLLDWSGAMGDESPGAFEELLAVDPANIVGAGSGELGADREALAARAGGAYDHLLVVVKSWEPPMAELADLLQELSSVERCTLYLLPLPGRAVPHRKVEDWRGFARRLSFAAVDVRLLNRVSAA